MRHSVFGRKLSRTTDERKRLFSGLVVDLLVRDSLVTTVAKAKSVQPIVEKLITKAKKGGEVNRRRIIASLGNRKLADQLLSDATTRFAGRTSGFTRVNKVGRRRGDATDTAQISFVDEKMITEVIAPKSKTKAKEVEKKEKKTVVKEKTKASTKKRLRSTRKAGK